MRLPLAPMLSQFGPQDVTVSFCGAIFSAVPFAPAFPHYQGLEDAVKAVIPDARPEHVDKARELAKSEDVERALFVAESLDTGDKGIAIYTGLKSAFKLFTTRELKKSFDADPQQAADAALKALGLAFLIDKVLPYPVDEKLHHFRSLPSGRSLALYFAALEVAVPFTDEVLAAEGHVLGPLLARAEGDNASRLVQAAGASALQTAKPVLDALTPSLEGILGKVVGYVGPVVEKAKISVPQLLDTSDRIGGAVATGADILPVWKLLGARLAAEAVALRAQHELDGKPPYPPPAPPPPPAPEPAAAAPAENAMTAAAAVTAAAAPTSPAPAETAPAETTAAAEELAADRAEFLASLSGAKLEEVTARARIAEAFSLARAALPGDAASAVLDFLQQSVAAVRAGERRAAPAAAAVPAAPAASGAAASSATATAGGFHAEVLFSPGELCVQRIAGLLGEAKRSVEICVFTVTDDRITSAILAAHRRGVRVRVVTDDEKAYDAGSDVVRLAEAGLDVRVDDSPFHMHHKFAIFDGTVVLTGSYNWTRGAAQNNEENLLVTDDPRLVRPYAAEFARLFGQFAPIHTGR